MPTKERVDGIREAIRRGVQISTTPIESVHYSAVSSNVMPTYHITTDNTTGPYSSVVGVVYPEYYHHVTTMKNEIENLKKENAKLKKRLGMEERMNKENMGMILDRHEPSPETD